MKLNKFLLWTILFLLAIFIYRNLAVNNLSNPNFWFDESGQFWMAKGLNHRSVPYSKEGGVREVINENKISNQDPGGFTLLLHFWTINNNSPFHLRLLPYLFYIGMTTFLSLSVWYWTKSVTLALLCLITTPLLKGMMLDYGFELRAYSMECMGLTTTIYIVNRLINSKSNFLFLLLVFCLSVFTTSRYSFIVVVAATFLLLGIYQFKYILSRWYYVTPLIVTIFGVYFLTYRFQFSSLTPPTYVIPVSLFQVSITRAFDILIKNATSFNGIWMFVSPTIYFTFFWFGMSRYLNKNFKIISIFSIFYNLILIVLSILGKYPWYIEVRWNIGMHVVNLICMWSIIGQFYTLLNSYQTKNSLSKYSPLVLLLCVVIGAKPIIFLARKYTHYFRNSYDSIYSNLSNPKLDEFKDSKLYISYNASPTWRYLNEYGPLKGNLNYPNNEIYETGEEYFKSSPIKEDVTYMIISHTNEDEKKNYSSRLGAKKVKDISTYPSSFLLKIE